MKLTKLGIFDKPDSKFLWNMVKRMNLIQKLKEIKDKELFRLITNYLSTGKEPLYSEVQGKTH